MKRSAAALAAFLLPLAACSAQDADDDGPRLTVTGAYVRQPPMPDMAAGYLTVRNSGTDADTLVAASSDISGEVQLHTTTPEGKMKQVESWAVPARGRLELSMGGDHLMLMRLKRMPKVGDTVTFTLRFTTSPPMTVRAPVKPTGHRPGSPGTEHEHG
ncbi:copper chaperone PCu(A)C [Actinomadura sp. KC345]|uniref:copper chaperone PCu(A)C n=1 Tax=Actinomadura sp. KC345 TaxID=2530371 RepID=UPI00104B72D1|nr:copper chaperone PCu(A)C [Actinomadura sp. KC345]TDC58627.1 copper chaperone PCu(A)C [Actinomadura sp. KC345]